jgi:hypothetical protein
MLLRATRFGHLRRRILSWCRRTRISASSAARGRNSPIKAHQINLQRSLIDRTINRFASVSQLLWVCGRDTPEVRSVPTTSSAQQLPAASSRRSSPPGLTTRRSMDWDDYLRQQAALYRQLAEKTEDAFIKQELLDLAAVCEEIANNIEDRLTSG